MITTSVMGNFMISNKSTYLFTFWPNNSTSESLPWWNTYTNMKQHKDSYLLLLFSHSAVSDSATPWTAACQPSLTFTISQSLLKLMSIESKMPSNHLFILIGFFPMSWLFPSGGQSIDASASTSVLPMNIQKWFPLGLTNLISLLSKGISRVFSSTTVWKYQFFSGQCSLWSNSHIPTWLLEKP